MIPVHQSTAARRSQRQQNHFDSYQDFDSNDDSDDMNTTFKTTSQDTIKNIVSANASAKCRQSATLSISKLGRSSRGANQTLSTIAGQLLSSNQNGWFNCVSRATLLLVAVICLSSPVSLLATSSSLTNSELDRRLALDSEIASLLIQTPAASRQDSIHHADQDWRDKALASAIISRIMLDNLTNPSLCADGGCANGADSQQLASFSEDEQQQQQQMSHQQQLVDETRLRSLLDQLQLLNSNQGANQEAGEFVLAPMLPADQMASIKRAASNRLHSKLHLRGLAGDSPATSTSSNSGWQGTTHAHELGLGALKRPDSGSILRLSDGPSFIKRPSSSNRQFEFGLGKRVANPSYSRYDFGLGKRASQLNEYRYDFGLGK